MLVDVQLIISAEGGPEGEEAKALQDLGHRAMEVNACCRSQNTDRAAVCGLSNFPRGGAFSPV